MLIYAPDLKQHPLSAPGTQPAPSITSSYSNIAHDDLQTPADEADRPLQAVDPQPAPGSTGHGNGSPNGGSGGSEMFQALYRQAQALVDRDSQILPFATPGGYVPLLRHVGPDVAYVQARLAGAGGETVMGLRSWAGQVVLVVGDDTGHGGLVDSEDERAGASGGEDQGDGSWWRTDESIGLGKGMEVVEGMRVGEDWRRRVRGHD